MNNDGIVILNVSEEYATELATGIAASLLDTEVTKSNDPDEIFADIQIDVSKGQQNLIMKLNPDYEEINYSKLAEWKNQMNDCCWLSDYQQ